MRCSDRGDELAAFSQVFEQRRNFAKAFAKQLLGYSRFVAIVCKVAKGFGCSLQRLHRVLRFEFGHTQAQGGDGQLGVAAGLGAAQRLVELDQAAGHGVKVGAGSPGDALEGADVLDAGAGRVFEVVEAVNRVGGAFDQADKRADRQAAGQAADHAFKAVADQAGLAVEQAQAFGDAGKGALGGVDRGYADAYISHTSPMPGSG